MADVDIAPSDLKFRFSLGKQLLSTITINNRSAENKVAFKIKTTAPKKYVVRPSSGVVEPRSSLAVQVIMQAQKEYPADFANCKDKFMVQTTALVGDEQIDKDTFSKDLRKDLKESRLRVVMEGPPAAPSPVPEAPEHDVAGAAGEAVAADGGAARGASLAPAASAAAAKQAAAELTSVASENTALKARLDAVSKDRDELRRKLDYIELQGGAAALKGAAGGAGAGGKSDELKFRVSLIHLVLVAIIAFIVGFYVN